MRDGVWGGGEELGRVGGGGGGGGFMPCGLKYSPLFNLGYHGLCIPAHLPPAAPKPPTAAAAAAAAAAAGGGAADSSKGQVCHTCPRRIELKSGSNARVPTPHRPDSAIIQSDVGPLGATHQN